MDLRKRIEKILMDSARANGLDFGGVRKRGGARKKGEPKAPKIPKMRVKVNMETPCNKQGYVRVQRIPKSGKNKGKTMYPCIPGPGIQIQRKPRKPRAPKTMESKCKDGYMRVAVCRKVGPRKENSAGNYWVEAIKELRSRMPELSYKEAMQRLSSFSNELVRTRGLSKREAVMQVLSNV
jgi:hypothetical protein